MRRHITLLALVALVLAGVAAACSGSGTSTPSQCKIAFQHWQDVSIVNGEYVTSSAGAAAETATISACTNSADWLTTASGFTGKDEILSDSSQASLLMVLGNNCRNASMTPSACKTAAGSPVSTIYVSTTTTPTTTPTGNVGTTCKTGVGDLATDWNTNTKNSNTGIRCVAGKWIWLAAAGTPTTSAWTTAITSDGRELKGRFMPSLNGWQWQYADDSLIATTGGTLTVGTGAGQLRPGTYEAFNVRDCYWERRDNNGTILANNFGSAGRMQFAANPGESVTINAAGTSSSCGFTRMG
jgi:hypothetical protein